MREPLAANHRVVVTRRGGPEIVELIEEPLPEPKPREARVWVGAAGVSDYDMTIRSGPLFHARVGTRSDWCTSWRRSRR